MNDLRQQTIHHALRHVENGAVYRDLLAGKSWPEAFGIGGSSEPVPWMGTSKGITYDGGLITPAEIISYVRNSLATQQETVLTKLFGLKWFAESRGIKQGEQLKIEFI